MQQCVAELQEHVSELEERIAELETFIIMTLGFDPKDNIYHGNDTPTLNEPSQGVLDAQDNDNIDPQQATPKRSSGHTD